MSSSACNLISIETRRLQNLQTHHSLIQLTKQPLSQLSSTRDLPRLSKCTSIYSNCAYHVTTTTNMPSDQSQFVVVQQQPSLAEEQQTSTTPMIVTTTTTTPTSPATTSATSTVGTTITTNEEKMFQLIEQLSDHHEKSQMYSNRKNNHTNNNNNNNDDDDDDRNDNKDHDEDMELKKKKRQTFRMVSVSDYSAMNHALLDDFGGEESMVIRILKSMQQSTIMHVLVLVKALLQKPHKILTKDVQGSWNISIYFPTMNHSMTSSGSRNLSLETTGHPQKICVCHRRREQVYEKVVNNSEDGDGGRKTTFRNLFQFEWQICFFLDEWSDSSSSGGGGGSGGVFDVFVQLMNTDIGTDETRDVSAQKQAVHSVFSEINDLEYESTLQSLKEENNGENQSSSTDQNNDCEGGHVNKQQVKQPLLDEEAQKKNQQTQQHQHQSRTHLHPHFSLESTKNRISKSISKLSLFSCSEKLDENEDQRPQKSPKSPRR